LNRLYHITNKRSTTQIQAKLILGIGSELNLLRCELLRAFKISRDCVQPRRIEIGLRHGVLMAKLFCFGDPLVALLECISNLAFEPETKGEVRASQNPGIITKFENQCTLSLDLIALNGPAQVFYRAVEITQIERQLAHNAMG